MVVVVVVVLSYYSEFLNHVFRAKTVLDIIRYLSNLLMLSLLLLLGIFFFSSILHFSCALLSKMMG